jgi:hypothetical protein
MYSLFLALGVRILDVSLVGRRAEQPRLSWYGNRIQAQASARFSMVEEHKSRPGLNLILDSTEPRGGLGDAEGTTDVTRVR